MSEENPNLNIKQKVEFIVAQIPEGRLMTYGQLAALVGHPQAARVVGGVAHFGDPSLPWHRVVNKEGGLASGYPGGRRAHKEHLLAEGVYFNEDRADIDKLVWWPNE